MAWTKEQNRAYQREYYLRRKAEYSWITLRLSHEDLEAIDRAARRAGASRSEKVREYIAWGLEADK